MTPKTETVETRELVDRSGDHSEVSVLVRWVKQLPPCRVVVHGENGAGGLDLSRADVGVLVGYLTEYLESKPVAEDDGS